MNKRCLSGFWVSDDEGIFLYIDESQEAGYLVSKKENINNLVKVKISYSYNPFSKEINFPILINKEKYLITYDRVATKMQLSSEKLSTTLYKETKV